MKRILLFSSFVFLSSCSVIIGYKSRNVEVVKNGRFFYETDTGDTITVYDNTVKTIDFPYIKYHVMTYEMSECMVVGDTITLIQTVRNLIEIYGNHVFTI